MSILRSISSISTSSRTLSSALALISAMTRSALVSASSRCGVEGLHCIGESPPDKSSAIGSSCIFGVDCVDKGIM